MVLYWELVAKKNKSFSWSSENTDILEPKSQISYNVVYSSTFKRKTIKESVKKIILDSN